MLTLVDSAGLLAALFVAAGLGALAMLALVGKRP